MKGSLREQVLGARILQGLIQNRDVSAADDIQMGQALGDGPTRGSRRPVKPDILETRQQAPGIGIDSVEFHEAGCKILRERFGCESI